MENEGIIGILNKSIVPILLNDKEIKSLTDVQYLILMNEIDKYTNDDRNGLFYLISRLKYAGIKSSIIFKIYNFFKDDVYINQKICIERLRKDVKIYIDNLPMTRKEKNKYINIFKNKKVKENDRT